MKPDIKKDFSRFLAAAPERLHMAAHSHHYWPDVTFDAHMQAWTDAAVYADRKWEYIFENIIPEAQRGVARLLSLPAPDNIVFAQNTHEFILRLLSCLPVEKTPHILTTDGEFHSFDRQIRRLEEDNLVAVTRIAIEPFDSFTARFAQAAQGGAYDMVFFSHVFFNSGFCVPDISAIVAAVKNSDSFVVIDGYHAFMALPVDWRALADRAFYIGGGYKYAMAGEGACFMYCPPGFGARPRNTGWFAGFGALANARDGSIGYGDDASRFAGATADISGLYRLCAVMAWLQKSGIDISDIHSHAHGLQKVFAEGLDAAGTKNLSRAQLAVPLSQPSRGNFLTFRTPAAAAICETLLQKNVITDRRGDCLRFGFGPYHDVDDIQRLIDIVKTHVR